MDASRLKLDDRLYREPGPMETSPTPSASCAVYPPLPQQSAQFCADSGQPSASGAQQWLGGQMNHGAQTCAAQFLHHEMPHISTLLLREAEAWRAALNLHSNVMQVVKQASADDEDGSQHREQAYCSALSSLAVQCDALHLETIKLRSLRKARRSVELEIGKELVKAHNNEVLAIGQAIASQNAVALSALTAELRTKMLSEKNYLTQMRSLLDTLREAGNGRLGEAKPVVGVQSEDGEVKTEPLDAFVREIYASHRELTEDAVCDLLCSKFLGKAAVHEAPKKQFARRTTDRELISDATE